MSVKISKPNIFFCNSCVYPSSSAVSLDFNSNKICTGCQVTSEKKNIDWEKRKSFLLDIIKEYYGYSNSKAKEALNVLSKDQIDEIKTSLKKGGRKWVKKK